MTRWRWSSRLGTTAFLAGVIFLGSYPVQTATEFSEWSAATNLGAAVNSEFEELLGVIGVQPRVSPAATATDGPVWTTAVNLGALVNSPFEDLGPRLSKDQLSLYFASNRPGFGGDDIWVAQRVDPEAPWGLPTNLGSIVNSGSDERTPSLSRDGHYLFFVSGRPGGYGGFDVWVSWRQKTDDDFGWQTPVNLGASVNSAANDAGPTFFENAIAGFGELLFASNRPGMGAYDIYSSLLVGGTFQFAEPAIGLNTEAVDLSPHMLKHGLEIYIASTRSGTFGLLDLWVSQRETLNDGWTAPVNLGPTINTRFREWFPSVTSDGLGLYFASNRPGGSGDDDIYFASRTK